MSYDHIFPPNEPRLKQPDRHTSAQQPLTTTSGSSPDISASKLDAPELGWLTTPATDPSITRSQWAIKGVLSAVDLAAALIGIAIASVLTGIWDLAPSLAVLATGAVWAAQRNLYRSRFLTGRGQEATRVAQACALTFASTVVCAFVFGFTVGRSWLSIATALSWLGISIGREVRRRRFRSLRRQGRMLRGAVLIGTNDEAVEFAEMLLDDSSLGYEITGRIDPLPTETPRILTTRVLRTVREVRASTVLIASSAVDMASVNRLIRDLVDAGIHVELSSSIADIAPSRLTMRPLGRFPVLYVEPVRRGGWRAKAKRLFDVSIAAGTLVACIPVLTVIALGIRVTSPGPVLFRQRRVGLDAVPFDVLKFRTMVVDAEDRLAELQAENEAAGPLFKMKDDPRITGIGSILRRTSLDELPQLFNVLRGEMSLVGPRPALPSETAQWDADLHGRLRVKPGITGMWQVSGRSSTSFEEYSRLDLYYVDNWSLLVDLSILFKTVPAVLKSDGAY